LQARGSLETYNSQGRQAQVPYVVFITCSFFEVPTGDFKQNDKAEFQSKFSATYIKQVVDGNDVLEVDAMANIYKVNGVDKLDLYRTNIGGYGTEVDIKRVRDPSLGATEIKEEPAQ
jgi:P2 family phage contractile tail tube protein